MILVMPLLTNFETNDFNKMKKDKIEFYKNEQKKYEDDKGKKDDIIEAMVSSKNIFTEDEIKSLLEFYGRSEDSS